MKPFSMLHKAAGKQQYKHLSATQKVNSLEDETLTEIQRTTNFRADFLRRYRSALWEGLQEFQSLPAEGAERG